MSDSQVSMHNPGNDAPAEAPAAPDAAAQKQMEQAYAQMKRKMAMAEIGKKIKHKIMVLSGKGASVNPLSPQDSHSLLLSKVTRSAFLTSTSLAQTFQR